MSAKKHSARHYDLFTVVSLADEAAPTPLRIMVNGHDVTDTLPLTFAALKQEFETLQAHHRAMNVQPFVSPGED
jgi:hypothetical protein